MKIEGTRPTLVNSLSGAFKVSPSKNQIEIAVLVMRMKRNLQLRWINRLCQRDAITRIDSDSIAIDGKCNSFVHGSCKFLAG